MGCNNSKSTETNDSSKSPGMGCDNSKSAGTSDPSKQPGKSLTEEEAVALVQKELELEKEQAEKMVKKCDSNKDGQVSEEEITKLTKEINTKKAEIKTLFEEYDKDKSGEVTVDEALTALRPKFPKVSDGPFRAMICQYDKDKNGKIKYDEFSYFYAQVSAKKEKISAEFKRMDTDNSGNLSLLECQNLLQEEAHLLPYLSQAVFSNLDLNNDDKLNKEEFEKMFLDFFG